MGELETGVTGREPRAEFGPERIHEEGRERK